MRSMIQTCHRATQQTSSTVRARSLQDCTLVRHGIERLILFKREPDGGELQEPLGT